MNKAPLLIPEYGMGGDYTGARRGRRAFRLVVVLVLAFTVALWFSEERLKYELLERQYMDALTLAPDSARAFLRHVVKDDEEQHPETPSPRYLEALAQIEEEDLVLPRYEQAYRVAQSNSSLIINYGCRLFLEGHYQQARDRFREAGVQASNNALPRYLEAAALALGSSASSDLSEPLSIIARANNSRAPLVFPEPLWHSGLSMDSIAYETRRHEAMQRCLEPLYKFTAVLLARARADIESGRMQDWDSWLEQIERMGGRILGSPENNDDEIALPRALAGIQFSRDAVQLRARIKRFSGESDAEEALGARAEVLRGAWERLRAYDEQRATAARERENALEQPLKLIAGAFALFLFFQSMSMLVYRFQSGTRSAWSLAHSRLTMRLVVTVFAGMLLLLCLLSFTLPAQPELRFAAACAWYAMLAVILGYGLVYPMLVLPQPQTVIERMDPVDEQDFLPLAKRARAEARFSLMRRYYGILTGAFMIIACMWFLAFFYFNGANPLQVNLLVPSMRAAEITVIRELQQALAPG